PSLKEIDPNDYSLSAKILIDTGLSEHELIFLALYYKLTGIFETDCPPELLLKCFKKVLKGEFWISKKFTQKVFFEFSFISQNKLPNISHREMEIINLVIDGFSNTEIAKKLYLSNYTVKCHLNRIYKKLGISSRTQLIKLFNKNNINLSHFGSTSQREKSADKIEKNQTDLATKSTRKIIKIKLQK
ncbi:MAG: response regulator transcription factor, partial [Caldimicrobium sp.]